jgi:hypothetical protein
MTLDQFYLLISGFLGVLFHCFLKLNSLLKLAQKANIRFNWYRDYVYRDFPTIALSVLSVLIWYFCFKEVAARYHSLDDFARVSFVTMGAIGSYIIQRFLSQAQKKIDNAIDVKTDIADGKK